MNSFFGIGIPFFHRVNVFNHIKANIFLLTSTRHYFIFTFIFLVLKNSCSCSITQGQGLYKILSVRWKKGGKEAKRKPFSVFSVVEFEEAELIQCSDFMWFPQFCWYNFPCLNWNFLIYARFYVKNLKTGVFCNFLR